MPFSPLDLIFPKRCVSCGKVGSYLCRDCLSKIEYIEKPVCPVCQRQAIGGKTHPGCVTKYGLDGLAVACRYQGTVKKAIAKVKYKWVYDIGKLMTDLVVENIWRFDLPTDLLLTPVPLHPKREKWRGFNQARVLAELLAKKFNVPIADTMIRISETKSQVGLKKDDRHKNVRGAFAIHPARYPELDSGSDVAGMNIILVDDVFTSGATMAECAKVLKRAGAKAVWACAVALG